MNPSIEAKWMISFVRFLMCSVFITTAMQVTAQQPNTLTKTYQKNLWRADRLRDDYKYDSALNAYKRIHKNNQQDVAVHLRLADTYRLLNNSEKSAYWYSQVIKDSLFLPIDRFHYAQALCMNKDYEKAMYYFKQYRNDMEEQHQHAKKTLGKTYSPLSSFDSPVYVVERLSINCLGADFSPVFFKQGLIYVTARGRNLSFNAIEKDSSTESTYLDFYFSTIKSNTFSLPVAFDPQMNTKLNEGPLVIFDNDQKMIFTRNYLKKKRKNKNVFGKLRIYTSRLINSDSTNWEWSSPKMLPFIKANDNASYGHPATDGKVLYFVSNKPGGVGDADIYRSEFKDGTWREPTNLGATINTQGAELFPYIGPDNMLYFASDGRDGLGGLDIFRVDPDSGEKPVNLGFPINTRFDDFGMILDPTSKSGYLSSNRANGKDDDIYRFYPFHQDSLYRFVDSLFTVFVAADYMSVNSGDEYSQNAIDKQLKSSESNPEGNDASPPDVDNAHNPTPDKKLNAQPLLDQSKKTPSVNKETPPNNEFVDSVSTVFVAVDYMSVNSGDEYSQNAIDKQLKSSKSNPEGNDASPPDVDNAHNPTPDKKLNAQPLLDQSKKTPSVNKETPPNNEFVDSVSTVFVAADYMSVNSGDEYSQNAIDKQLKSSESNPKGNDAISPDVDNARNPTPDKKLNAQPLLDQSKKTPSVNKETPNAIFLLRREVGKLLRPIYFDFSKFSLSKAAMQKLNTLAKVTKQHPYTRLKIATHAGSRGTRVFNKALSTQRSDAVVSYLAGLGIAKNHLHGMFRVKKSQ